MGGQEIGLIESDKRTHVVVPRLSGPRAACNDEPIVTRLPGVFDPSDPLACGDCVELTKAG